MRLYQIFSVRGALVTAGSSPRAASEAGKSLAAPRRCSKTPDDTTARSLVMRLGSEINRRNAVPFDGGYTVLRVRLVGPDSFLGSWASGTVTEVAAGFFCAVRRSNNL